MSEIANVWLDTLKWMAILAVLFGVLTTVMPCNKGMRWWSDRKQLVADMYYWFVVPLVVRIFRILMFMTAVGLLFKSNGQEWLADFFENGYGWAREQPLWLQCVLVLLIEDVILYWLHRGFHGRKLWRFHAIHHSTKYLDWMSTSRFHPVNQLFQFTIADITVLLMGFPPLVLAALAPFNIIYSGMVHANLNWTFGPFKYVFASPVFHRWHHTHPSEGGNKNFAPTFPILDVIFGTFYMPKGKLPQEFGVTDKEFPDDFWAQMAYPFRRRKKS